MEEAGAGGWVGICEPPAFQGWCALPTHTKLRLPVRGARLTGERQGCTRELSLSLCRTWKTGALSGLDRRTEALSGLNSGTGALSGLDMETGALSGLNSGMGALSGLGVETEALAGPIGETEALYGHGGREERGQVSIYLHSFSF